MLISIAMCTYNGANHIEEQLDSIASQSRLPDEVVICDDRSTDNTVNIINNFAANAIFPVRLVINVGNLGSTKNFEKAIEMCGGDIIVLADQDDVWYPNKLRSIEQKFLESPSVLAVFSNADVVDEHLKPLGYTLWQSVFFTSKLQDMITSGKAFHVLVNNNFVTGATMAFRSQARDIVIPIPAFWVHDGWIALLASATGDVAIISEPLIKYRQHSDQQIGALRKKLTERLADSAIKNPDYFKNLADQYIEAFDRLKSNRKLCDSRIIDSLEEKVKHLKTRHDINNSGLKRIVPILSEIMKNNYHKYSNGLGSAFKDLAGNNTIKTMAGR